MEQKINRYIKIYPWYSGFVGDLLFYIAIDTLFLTLVKQFSPSEIVSIASLSQLACIALQFPILFIIKKIGNTASTWVGALLLLLSAIFITFGKSYYLVLLGRVLHDASIIFKAASTVALENNLDAVGRRNEFVRVRTASNTAYSVITMLISFVASWLFNLNHYLPMYCCIATCTIGFILSLFLKDYTDYNKIQPQKGEKARAKIHYSKIILLIIVIYGIFYPIVSHSQNEGKLFIQEHLLLDFDEDATSLIIGAILCASRIIRVFSNLIFGKLYEKYQSKMGIALPAVLAMAIGLLLGGSFIGHTLAKILVMSVGYTILLFVRDPFKLYIQDVLFMKTPKEQHQTLLTILEFGVKVASAGIGLAFSAILVSYPLLLVVGIMLAIALVEVVLSIILYRAILLGNNQPEPLATHA